MKIYQVEEFRDEQYNEYSAIVGTFLNVDNAKKFKEKMGEKYLVSGLISGNCRMCESIIDEDYESKEDAENGAKLLIKKCGLAKPFIGKMNFKDRYFLDCNNQWSVDFLNYRIIECEVLDAD